MTGSADATGGPPGAFGIKSLLVPLLKRPRIAQFIKWFVYGCLVINFGIYVYDDWTALQNSLPADAALGDVLERFSTSVDMLAWLGLVFLFELETYVLPDDAFTPGIVRTFLIARVICYVAIFLAAYGYTVETLENYDVTEVSGLTNLCDIADKQRYVQTDTITYTEITADNCSSIATGPVFYQIGPEVSVIDSATLSHVQWQGWIDVVNAVVWLIVVALIEVEVWLQSHDRFGSRALTPVRTVKTVGYAVLTANAVIWFATGYLVYGWDSFLWIFGFWAIELNLAEWEIDRIKELRASVNASATAS